ncbi:predicted protein [Sclerotinia sclerotiorum 1980 UF-70]|uniref:Uncharacterized protein n=1 Tax=Sclerotinia sclerotiorum (strain ATCC 18683 / 1980 / Ss-1) TaxID=665079 RepID=A7F4K0_SCLS1|nr:predicted protein [Sclerotinia sclerotiorum 1980 UF-70]EDN97671.1 predicted protein [Sclerotinia sclerotiorum 1980 UF-70]
MCNKTFQFFLLNSPLTTLREYEILYDKYGILKDNHQGLLGAAGMLSPERMSETFIHNTETVVRVVCADYFSLESDKHSKNGINASFPIIA